MLSVQQKLTTATELAAETVTGQFTE